jgi:protein-tyrosine phosphatase
MIDFHCHILPGIDDGPIDASDSVVMAAKLAEFGYRRVHCTPHCIKGYYELTPQQVREATLMLQADLDNADIALELAPGMEYMLDECFADFADQLQPLAGTELVLCEAPQQAHPGIVSEGLGLIVEQGFTPLVAHPERIQFFYEKLVECEAESEPRAEEARPKGFLQRLFCRRATRPVQRTSPAGPSLQLQTCLFQSNLGSFTGFYGQQVQQRAYELLKRGVYSAVATDLHDSNSASNILQRDKFELNPLLKQLSRFDGNFVKAPSDERTQGELF